MQILIDEQAFSSVLCRLLDIRINPDDDGLAFNYQVGHLVAVGAGYDQGFSAGAGDRRGLQVNFNDEFAVFNRCLHGLPSGLRILEGHGLGIFCYPPILWGTAGFLFLSSCS